MSGRENGLFIPGQKVDITEKQDRLKMFETIEIMIETIQSILGTRQCQEMSG